MRPHDHRLRAHPIQVRVLAVPHPGRDTAFGAAAMVAAFVALAAGWVLGGIALRAFGIPG